MVKRRRAEIVAGIIHGGRKTTIASSTVAVTVTIDILDVGRRKTIPLDLITKMQRRADSKRRSNYSSEQWRGYGWSRATSPSGCAGSRRRRDASRRSRLGCSSSSSSRKRKRLLLTKKVRGPCGEESRCRPSTPGRCCSRSRMGSIWSGNEARANPVENMTS